jgi:hypothetical protein
VVTVRGESDAAKHDHGLSNKVPRRIYPRLVRCDRADLQLVLVPRQLVLARIGPPAVTSIRFASLRRATAAGGTARIPGPTTVVEEEQKWWRAGKIEAAWRVYENHRCSRQQLEDRLDEIEREAKFGWDGTGNVRRP